MSEIEIASIPREAAAKLNPLIGADMLEDTLENCSSAIEDLGSIISMAAGEADTRFDRAYLILHPIAAALAYEAALLAA